MLRKKDRRLISLGTKDIVLDGQRVNYNLKLSHRINGLRMEIRPASGLTVIIAKSYDDHSVQETLRKKTRWILNHLIQMEERQLPLLKKEISQGDRLSYLGKDITITAKAESDKGLPELRNSTLFIDFNGPKHPAAMIEEWYRAQAKKIFIEKADSLKQQIGVEYRAILIRGQSTRWGSCSSRRNLTLNWKLLLAPEDIIEYVIIHELVHLKYMDHSKKFWDTVARFCPDWKNRKQWLIVHDNELKAAADLGC